jgi:hypothetical protein
VIEALASSMLNADFGLYPQVLLVFYAVNMPQKLPQFPMKFKESLRRIIGGQLYGDRLRIFRQFWYSKLKEFNEFYRHYNMTDMVKSDDALMDLTNQMIEKHNCDGIDEQRFINLSTEIPKWRAARRLEQRKNAAKKRWQK